MKKFGNIQCNWMGKSLIEESFMCIYKALACDRHVIFIQCRRWRAVPLVGNNFLCPLQHIWKVSD